MGRTMLAAALLAVAGLAAACGSSGSAAGVSKQTPTTTARGGTGVGASGTAETTTTVPVTSTTVPAVHVGTPLTVTDATGDEVQVTAAQVVSAATGSYAFAVPGAGMEYVGVQMSLSDAGTTPVQGDADTDTTITDALGVMYASLVVELPNCPSFAGGIFNLAPGAATVGCVSFEVPTGTAVTRIKFGLGGRLATNIGEWQVP